MSRTPHRNFNHLPQIVTRNIGSVTPSMVLLADAPRTEIHHGARITKGDLRAPIGLSGVSERLPTLPEKYVSLILCLPSLLEPTH